MKPRTGLLIISFIAFYAMIHLGRYLPDLYTGRFSLVDERSFDLRMLSVFADMFIAFLFTISAFYTLDKTYPSRQYFFLVAGLAATFILCFTINYLASRATSPDPVRLSRFFRGQILYSAFYSIFGMAFYFVRYAQYKELQQKELAIQNRDSELSFLRSQINPHFLFNNLNNIYSLVYHQSDQSLAAISSLSELLRYMLYDTSETITLQKEIHYIEKYIALEQLRFEAPSKLSFSCTGDGSQAKLPPLLLIPFIENAFKHGEISFDHNWLEINIASSSDGSITLNCTNETSMKRKDAIGGIGIENVRKRLALLYPENHTLTISHDQNNKYLVALKLGSYASSTKPTLREIS